MARKGWWHEVSRDEYDATRTSYGSDIYALDPRLLDTTKDNSPPPPIAKSSNKVRKAFSRGEIYPAVPIKSRSQGEFSSDTKTKKSLARKVPGWTGAQKGSDQGSKITDSLKNRTNSEKLQLSGQAKAFIRGRIIELGSVERVREAYSREDKECRYARGIARLILRREKGAQIPGAETGPTAGAVPNQAEPVATIKHLMGRLETILRNWQRTRENFNSFQGGLQELRKIYRANKESFSANDIHTVQKYKEEFEKLIHAHIG
jgi:hypothetical protein